MSIGNRKENLAVRNARKQVQIFNQESTDLMAEHQEAMDCFDCEAFLQVGIDAFAWIMRADRETRLAYARGVEIIEPWEDALSTLCQQWMNPVSYAERWIAIQLERRYELDNLAEFRHCVEEMTAIIESRNAQDEQLPEAFQKLRDEALQEHLDGKTSEFV